MKDNVSVTTKMREVCRSAIETMDKLDAYRSLIEAAIDKGMRTHSFDDITQMVIDGHMTPWFLPNSIMLTNIVTHPSARHLHIFLAGGDLDEIIGQTEALREAAKAADCDRVTINGRPGWARALANIPGVRQTYTMMAMEV